MKNLKEVPPEIEERIFNPTVSLMVRKRIGHESTEDEEIGDIYDYYLGVTYRNFITIGIDDEYRDPNQIFDTEDLYKIEIIVMVMGSHDIAPNYKLFHLGYSFPSKITKKSIEMTERYYGALAPELKGKTIIQFEDAIDYSDNAVRKE